MKSVLSRMLGAGAVLGAGLGAGLIGLNAHAATTVFGEPLGRACYEAALEGRSQARDLAVCDQALEQEALTRRDRAGTYVNRGVLKLQRREPGAALADFDTAIGLMPELGEAHVNRGAALILRQDFAGAIEAITRGLSLNPSDPHEAYYNRALAHELNGDVRAAYADLRRSVEIAPEWPRAQLELARYSVQPRE